MKKWFTFLLLVITMASTFCPCCMEDDCADEAATEASHAHTRNGGNDVCSPFFACGTCAPAVDAGHSGIELVLSPVTYISHQSFYLVQLSSYNPNLFQPPRFA